MSGQIPEGRITGQRIWKIVKAVGARAGRSAVHPHALRHACGAELLRRTKNLRVVQEQLRHVDVQSTAGLHQTHAAGRSGGFGKSWQRGGMKKGFTSRPPGE